MLIDYKNGQTSIVLRVKLRDSSVTTGAGLTGLTSASSGLIISTIADNEATATAYTVAGSLIETITTLGTFETPTATKCRFKVVDATNHPGVYEIHIANARFAVASAKSLLVSITGATNLVQTDVLVPLRSVDPYDSVRFGMTALPNAAAAASGGLVINGSNTGTVTLAALTVTGALTGTGGIAANITGNITGNLVGTVSTLTTYTGNTPQTGDSFARIGALGAGLTALGDTRIANLDAAVSTRSTYAGADTSGTTTLLTRIPGTVQPQTGDSFARIGVAGAGLTALGDTRIANLDATVSSRLATASYSVPSTITLDNGTVSASPAPTTTSFTATGAGLNAPTNGYTAAPMTVFFTSGANKGVKFKIATHVVTGSNHAFTCDAMPIAPASTDTFVIG